MQRLSLSPLLIASAFALAPVTALMAPTGAHAQAVSQDYRCTTLPEQVRAAASASTDAAAVARAQRFLATGVSLCEARSEGPAARQFRSALRILGVEEARAENGNAVANASANPAGN